MSDKGDDAPAPALKVLMTADAVGGVWQYSLDLISHLVERSAQVVLATMGPRPSDSQKRRLENIPRVTLCESEYKLEWMHEPWADVDAAGDWLLQLARDFQPDVVHLNGYAHAALRWPAPVVVVAHSCVCSWWQAVHECAPPRNEWAEYRRRVTAGLHAADLVVAPSAFMADSLTANYGLPRAYTKVVHNFSESPLNNGIQKEPFYLAAGRVWDVGKNLQMLHDMADRLPWPTLIAGDLPHQTVLEGMQRAAVYVHPALYEPFGLAVLEAARAQCCLVLSDIPSLRELWDGAAVFVNPRNPDQWSSTLTQLSDNKPRRERLGRVARARAEMYNASSTVAEYWNAYESMVASRRSSRTGVAA